MIFVSRIVMLPVELLHVIAGIDMESYRVLLALPPFARSLDPGTVTDFMISFGFGVEITCDYIRWTRDEIAHRNGGPAVIYIDGTQIWCQHGKLHRDDGPVVIYPDGTLCWYQYGKPHRDGEPAVIYPDGTQIWYQHGQRGKHTHPKN
jgi:hypothetical protein